MIKLFEEYIKELWGTGENKDFNGEYIPNANDSYEYIHHDFDLEEVFEDLTEISKEDFLANVSEETLQNMFPVYKEFDVLKDWHIRCYHYVDDKDFDEDYLIFVKSMYNYTFKKK